MRRLLPALLTALFAFAPLSAAEAKPKGKPAAKAKKGGGKGPDLKLKSQPAPEDAADASAAPLPSRGPARIDFDDRLIQGQTNKSGAVYLYERKELRTNSMLKTPETFRHETVETVFGG